jgi:hypothetical protein
MLLQAGSIDRLLGERKISNSSAVLHFRRKLVCEISFAIRRYNDSAQRKRARQTRSSFLIIEANVALSGRRRLLLGGSDVGILESFIDTLDKAFVIKRLAQETKGPTVQDPPADLFIKIGCHKNHRCA